MTVDCLREDGEKKDQQPTQNTPISCDQIKTTKLKSNEEEKAPRFRLLARPEPVRTHASSTSSGGNASCCSDSTEALVEESKPADAAADSHKTRCDTADPTINLHEFIVTTLKRGKDRLFLLQLEEQMISFVNNPTERALQFPSLSSYHRMLVHRVAAYFGLDHNMDASSGCVIVERTAHTSLPTQRFHEHIEQTNNDVEAPKTILKRVPSTSSPPVEQAVGSSENQTRTKTVAEREAEYELKRARIFNQPTPTPSSKPSRESSDSPGARSTNRHKKPDGIQRQQSAPGGRRVAPRHQKVHSPSTSTLAEAQVPPLVPIPGATSAQGVQTTWNKQGGRNSGQPVMLRRPSASTTVNDLSRPPLLGENQLVAQMASLGLESDTLRRNASLAGPCPPQARTIPVGGRSASTNNGSIAFMPAAALSYPVSTGSWQPNVQRSENVSVSSATTWSTTTTDTWSPVSHTTLPNRPSVWPSTAAWGMQFPPAQYSPGIVMEVYDLPEGSDANAHLSDLKHLGAVLQYIQGRILAVFYNFHAADYALKSNNPSYKLRVLQAPWSHPTS